MDEFVRLVEKIISEQETVIGPLAVEQAGKVSGLTIDWQKHKVEIHGDKKTILEELAHKYEGIFGEASLEVCRTVIKRMLPKISIEEIPSFLQ